MKKSEPLINAQLLNELPALERHALEMLAVAMGTITRTHLTTALRRLGCRGADGKSLKGPSLAGPLRALDERGLIARDGLCDLRSSAVGDAVMLLLLEDGRYSRLAEILSVVCPLVKNSTSQGEPRWKSRGLMHYARELRTCLVAEDWKRAMELRDGARGEYGDGCGVISRAMFQPVDQEWLERLSGPLAIALLEEVLVSACVRLEPIDDLLLLCKGWVERHGGTGLRIALSEALILSGRQDEAGEILAEGSSSTAISLSALLLANAGDFKSAVGRWEEALRLRRKESRNRSAYLEDLGALFFPLALIATGALDRAVVMARIAMNWGDSGTDAFSAVETAVTVRRGHKAYWFSARRYHKTTNRPRVVLAELLARYAGAQPIDGELGERAADLAERAQRAGLYWLSHQLHAICGRSDASLPTGTGVAWTEGLAPPPQWRRRLDALLAIAPPAKNDETPSDIGPANERLVWFLKDDAFGVQPKLQKRGKRDWTKGRNIALKRLHGHPEDPDLLSEHDRRVLAHLKHESYIYRGYREDSYEFSYPEVLDALIGHPLLFDESSGTKATIIKFEPRVRLLTVDDSTHITIEPIPMGRGYSFERTGDGRFRFVMFDEVQRTMAKEIDDGLTVPAGETADIIAAMSLLSEAFPVESSGVETEETLGESLADTEVRVFLEREGDGLAVQLRVRPWDGGPALRPGAGGATLRHSRDGVPVLTQRDLDAERREALSLLDDCPALYRGGDLLTDDGLFADPHDALRVLLQLHENLEPGRIEWHGARPWLLTEIADDAMQLILGEVGGWFKASGTLRVDEEMVLDLRELLRLHRRRHGRFLPLGDDRFAVLSEETTRHLDNLMNLAMESDSSETRFHRLAVPALVEAMEGLGAKTDRAWQELVKALTPAREDLVVPASLKAELRPYQEDGFRWLATLAGWGAGACLADDMGLGKTVQALALLVSRAGRGPALVVAPTSVVPGWRSEATRFAPSLRCVVLGKGDRLVTIEALGPGDLLLCSYGLLVTERAALEAVRWSQVILDEAQAIKNPTTARAQAAFALDAESRVVLTGTPVENRMLDLWSIFHFLNRGLLGTSKEFKARFVRPIEADSDKRARAALSARVRPYVLRRTKSAVLQELPPRTESVLPVVLHEEEASLYEAIRREALDELHESPDVMKVLSWLTRLRLACCHPALAGQAGLSSSKTATFRELLRALLDGGHRVLVFSQFVRHLELVRRELDERGVSYQYLDGSMSSARRHEAVERFEGGEGDLFLISLRAGGAGLNLTSADCVIHLDPWWNPAVEDQASDRVHRIGQRRPVVIYRLVAQGTVEEEIMALHNRKRELADSLLAGTDRTAGLTAAQLLELFS